MSKIKLLAGVAAIAVIAAPAARAGSLYAFGDSLSDNGNLYKLDGGLYPSARTGFPSYEGRFSNGPVWVEYLPGMTGLSFSPGNDHAYGGAFTGPVTIAGVDYYDNFAASLLKTASLPGIDTEIAQFAAAGGSFAPSDVVTLWGGANNYFVYGDAVQTIATQAETLAVTARELAQQARTAVANKDYVTAQTDAAQAKADGAQAAQLAGSIKPLLQTGIQTTLTQLAEDTNALINLGAQMLIVPNLPDLGLTPAYRGTAAQSIATQISAGHNANLPVVMQMLHQNTGANIIVLNTEALLDTVEAKPALYGFTNATDACIDSTSCLNGSAAVQSGYLFWNDVHPTTHAQEVIAAYAARSLLGFESLTVPARLGADAAQNFTSVLNGRLDALQNGASGVAYGIDGMQGGTPDPLHKLSLFLSVGGQFGTHHTDADNFALGYSYSSAVTAVGLDYRWNQHVITGLALGYNDSHATVKDGGGKVDDHGVDVGLYGLVTEGDAYAKFTGGYDRDNYKTSRAGVIGGITSKPSGQTWSASTVVGLNFHPRANMILGPDVGLAYTNSGLGAYTENGDPLLTQAVNSQNFQQLIGSTGLHAATMLELNGVSLAPYASAAAEFRMSSQSRHFSSYYTDMPGVTLTNSYPTAPGSWALFSAGLNAHFGQRLNANLDIATTAFKSNGNDVQINGNVSWKF